MSLARSAAGVGVARGLGLAAAVGFTVFVAARFGSDRETDLVFTAVVIPQGLVLILASLLPPVFGSVFKSIESTRGADEAWAFARSASGLAAALAAAVSLAGALASPLLARLVCGGFLPEEIARVTFYMRVAFAVFFFTAVSCVLKGILNADGSFFVPSLDTMVLNVAAVTVVAFAAERWGAFAIVAGFVAGAAAKVLLVMPAYVRRRRGGPTPFFHPAMRESWGLLAPVLANSVLFAANQAIMRAMAARLPGEGAVSHLNYAEKVLSAPQDVLIVSMGVVLLPALSRAAAAGDLEEVRRRVTQGLRMALFFGIPAAVGLAMLAEPIVRLLYQRQQFGAADAAETARALRGYAASMAFAGHLIVYQAFYALRRTGAILACGAVGLTVTTAAGLVLSGPLRQTGIALAFSLAYAAGSVTSLALFWRAAGAPDVRALGSAAARAALAAGGMAAALWALGRVGGVPVLAEIAAGAAVFALLARFLSPDEWKLARKLWSRVDT